MTSFCAYGHSVFNTCVSLTEGRSARDLRQQKKIVVVVVVVFFWGPLLLLFGCVRVCVCCLLFPSPLPPSLGWFCCLWGLVVCSVGWWVRLPVFNLLALVAIDFPPRGAVSILMNTLWYFPIFPTSPLRSRVSPKDLSPFFL